ncbi:hypothetical protein CPB85DRAFT_627408 [Mucidula mucida]|nr:hypothetical protein CPB85DRAFT_627408 [Mucidula mucida]
MVPTWDGVAYTAAASAIPAATAAAAAPTIRRHVALIYRIHEPTTDVRVRPAVDGKRTRHPRRCRRPAHLGQQLQLPQRATTAACIHARPAAGPEQPGLHIPIRSLRIHRPRLGSGCLLLLLIPVTTHDIPSPSGVSHPREYIRIHKAEIEAWDTYAWKQLIGAFDAVKDAWAAKKTEIEQKIQQFTMQMQYGGGGYHPMQIQQEIARLQGLMKDADANSDSAAAASFQMHEVFENYRKSGDLASKRRVREASNATLTGCPDWPPAIY